jgi:DnaJ-related protein SCJ1
MILRGAIFVLLALVSLAFCAEDFYKVRQRFYLSSDTMVLTVWSDLGSR